jgi:hypothetical protein
LHEINRQETAIFEELETGLDSPKGITTLPEKHESNSLMGQEYRHGSKTSTACRRCGQDVLPHLFARGAPSFSLNVMAAQNRARFLKKAVLGNFEATFVDKRGEPLICNRVDGEEPAARQGVSSNAGRRSS